MNAPPHTLAPVPADIRWAALAEAETLGQPLTPHDLVFLRTYVPTDPALRAEHGLRGALADWGEDPLPGEDDEAVLAAALDAHLHGPSERAQAGRGRVVWLAAAAGLAAAAAVVLAVAVAPGPTPPASDEVARVEAPVLGETPVQGEPLRATGALRGL
jgi:hypothetical protein